MYGKASWLPDRTMNQSVCELLLRKHAIVRRSHWNECGKNKGRIVLWSACEPPFTLAPAACIQTSISDNVECVVAQYGSKCTNDTRYSFLWFFVCFYGFSSCLCAHEHFFNGQKNFEPKVRISKDIRLDGRFAAYFLFSFRHVAFHLSLNDCVQAC